MKVKLLKGAWSSDGNILVKTMNDRVHRINELSDLFQFGFLVMGSGQPKRPPRFPSSDGAATKEACSRFGLRWGCWDQCHGGPYLEYSDNHA